MRIFYSLLLLLAATSMQAQFPYTLTYSDEPYVNFTDGTAAVSEVWDDPNFTVPIGFDFVMFGETVTSLTQLGLGAALATSEDYYAVNTYFLPYTSDIIDTGDISGEQESTITYKTTGSAPNRVFHLQWAECGFYENLNILQDNPSNGTVYRLTTEPLSVDELSEASLTPIYPNPASDAFIVSMPAYPVPGCHERRFARPG